MTVDEENGGICTKMCVSLIVPSRTARCCQLNAMGKAEINRICAIDGG